MGRRTRKAWNGGSQERAMELARESRAKMVEQGARYCVACNGEGGTNLSVCPECHGAGVILPPGGLVLKTERANA